MNEPVQQATIWYGGVSYTVPTEVGEDLVDFLLALDRVGGRHLFLFGGSGDDPVVRLWLTPGVPVAVHFPAGYETPEERDDAVDASLQRQLRFRLGRDPITGELDHDDSGED